MNRPQHLFDLCVTLPPVIAHDVSRRTIRAFSVGELGEWKRLQNSERQRQFKARMQAQGNAPALGMSVTGIAKSNARSEEESVTGGTKGGSALAGQREPKTESNAGAEEKSVTSPVEGNAGEKGSSVTEPAKSNAPALGTSVTGIAKSNAEGLSASVTQTPPSPPVSPGPPSASPPTPVPVAGTHPPTHVHEASPDHQTGRLFADDEAASHGHEPANPKRYPDGVRKSRPDTLEQVQAKCAELGLSADDAEAIWCRWQSNGFTVDRKPMKDWRAVIRTWQIHGYHASQKKGPPANGRSRQSAPIDMSKPITAF